MKELVVKDGVEKSNLVTDSFVRRYLDEELEEGEGERLNIRLNEDDRKILNELKEVLSIGTDATILKQGLRVYQNVIKYQFGSDLLKRLCSGDRRRPTPKELKGK